MYNLLTKKLAPLAALVAAASYVPSAKASPILTLSGQSGQSYNYDLFNNTPVGPDTTYNVFNVVIPGYVLGTASLTDWTITSEVGFDLDFDGFIDEYQVSFSSPATFADLMGGTHSTLGFDSIGLDFVNKDFSLSTRGGFGYDGQALMPSYSSGAQSVPESGTTGALFGVGAFALALAKKRHGVDNILAARKSTQ
jgi:hypothetical protein